MNILVTGGAGYIGGHTVRQLSEAGFKPIVLDNLSTGFKSNLLYGETLIEGDVGNQELVSRALSQHSIDSVIHFAASIVAPESVSQPLVYYNNNTASTINLLKACVENGVKNFIFSSTAAVYGIPQGPCTENSPTRPINPYGWSKLMSEQIIQDASAAHGFKFGILRYFNAAGADPKLRMGQRSETATHLIKVACEVALKKRKMLEIFGTDYSSSDGTCVRDYVHVEDLASAHILGLKYLSGGGKSQIFNVGFGKGHTVKEVVRKIKEISNSEILTKDAPRRPGDPPSLVANTEKIRSELGWNPNLSDLQQIVKTAWEWESRSGV